MLSEDVKSYNFAFLLAGLLLCIVLLPLISGLDLVTTALMTEVAFLLTLLIGVWSLLGNRLWFRIGIALTALTGLMTVTDAFLPNEWLSRASALLTLLFLLLSSALAFRSVFSSGQVDVNRLLGAACPYLMIAPIWALLYMLLDSFNRESLTNLATTTYPFWEYLYFSFVTLTTLGYGDIAPASAAARVLAGLEAVLGQFYLTLLVAALVGMHIAQRTAGRD